MERLSRIFREVEMLDHDVRAEIAGAAGEGKFEEVSALTAIAKEIAEIAARWRSSTVAGAIVPPPIAVDHAQRSAGNSRQAIGRLQEHQRSYPQFLREKNNLVKVGWSSQDREGYEHRVSKALVDVICRAVAETGKTGRRFKMDEVVSATTKSGNAVPLSYQIYAVVAWLKWAGMVVQHGRQGYTLVRPRSFSAALETAWLSLPQR
jgi:hypothetical protein